MLLALRIIDVCRVMSFVFQAEDGIRYLTVTGVQTCALPIYFNLTVELPLKAIIRGYTFSVVPNHWINRKTGESKLKIKEMGSRYLFIILYCFIEKWLSRGDYVSKRGAGARKMDQRASSTKS